jgi:hypothetical protein
MSLPFSSDQTELADTIRRFLNERVTSDYLRKRPAGVSDTSLFKDLTDLGLLTSFLPEKHGGGFGFRELGLFAVESGRGLLPEPVLEMAFCNYLLGRSEIQGFDAVALSKIFNGKHTAIFIPSAALLRFEKSKDTCSFEASFAIGAKKADYAIGYILGAPCLIELGQVERSDISLVDSTVGAVRLVGKGCRCWSLSDGSKAEILFGIIKGLEILGAAEKGMAMTIDYVKTRKQFDAPVGSFQAVQHKLAEAHVNLSAMRALGTFAAWAVESSTEQVHISGNSFVAFAADKGAKILETCVQMHGGTGFTWEYDLHLYLRRTKMLGSLLAEIVKADDILKSV